MRNTTIKKAFYKLGANVCGIASIDRFHNSPSGFHPQDIYQDCQTVIVFGKAMPIGTLEVDSRIIYLAAMKNLLHQIDMISLMACQLLEHGPQRYIPIPADDPYEYWDEVNQEGRGLISLRHAAVAAGLGEIGKNTLLLNKKFGNRLALGAVLTNETVTADELKTEKFCIESCRLCLDNCPQRALDGLRVNQKKCREIIYGRNAKGYPVCQCNICRVICPVRYG